jgi:OOP family OmpA-OmpF porin
LPATIVSGGKVPTSGIGDVSILGKGTLFRNDPHGVPLGFGLAALGALSVPTGDRASFASDGSVTVSVRLMAEYALGVGALRASLGYTLRTAQQTWPDASLGGVTFGDELPWSIGATLRPKGVFPSLDSGDRQSWEIALHGALPVTPVAPFQPGASSLSPALLAVDDRIGLGHYRDAFVLAGVDLGLDTSVGVPAVPCDRRGGLGAASARPRRRRHPRRRGRVPRSGRGLRRHPGRRRLPGGRRRRRRDPRHAGRVPARARRVVERSPEERLPRAGHRRRRHPRSGRRVPRGEGRPQRRSPKKNGCPPASQDRDHDGIPDDADKCPDQPEDMDGFEDFDGCPDPDDDGDGIPDKEDACPRVKGEPSTDPTRNGCPNPDRDGDTYDNDVDRCPDQAEVFNGVKDDDGCPDEGGRPLVVVDVVKGAVVLHVAQPILFTGTSDTLAIDPKSATTLRAIALELNRRPDWTLAVGARPGAGAPEEAQRGSLQRAMLVANRIATYTHRPGAAEAVGWDAVKQQPGATTGVGFLVLLSTRERPPSPLPDKKDPKEKK